MEKKNSLSKCIIWALLSGIIGGILTYLIYENNIIISIIGGLIIGIIIFFVVKYDKVKPKDDLLKDIPTEELKKSIDTKKELLELEKKEYSKRKDKSIHDKIYDEYESIIFSGIVILLLGLFYLGALPNYFGVNNEFTNPSNSSLGLNNSFDLVKNAGLEVSNGLINIGSSHPIIFFWLFWIVVLVFFVYPIVKILYLLFKKLKEKIKLTREVK